LHTKHDSVMILPHD